MKASLLVSTAMVLMVSTESAAVAQGSAMVRGDSVAAKAGAPANQAGVQEIVVTAQRREESIQKTPVTVTAVSGVVVDDPCRSTFGRAARPVGR